MKKLKRFKLIRKLVFAVVGIFTYPGIAIINKLSIRGTEHLKGLPKSNVLFV
ncbi:MAG: 1-acyl-sn-glycerol-3-phosphate acyltransferase, partial [Chitinophagia bacterium]|nr:1-acyl-sn-glycerol-3-phosphate acyltransferase [Chitinophagia bacterium]